ncbi:hypothetical protein CSM99_004357 [Salmonella enterica subsp. diarizonae]|nr:hypothetical protein [Salmonella enterica subsp. diarizonae]ELO2187639.1 hypothetical protein [Salmonella enterica]
MLITLELLLRDDLRRSLFTLGSMTVEQKPALESAISDYAGAVCDHAAGRVGETVQRP